LYICNTCFLQVINIQIKNHKNENNLSALKLVQGFINAINDDDFAKSSESNANKHEYWGLLISAKNPKYKIEKLMTFEMEFTVKI
jgi:hypothetical protein